MHQYQSMWRCTSCCKSQTFFSPISFLFFILTGIFFLISFILPESHHTFRLHTASLLQAMRSTSHAWSYKAWCSAVISCFSKALIGAFRSLLIIDLLPRRPAVAGLSCCWVFDRFVRERPKPCRPHQANACTDRRLFYFRIKIHILPV